MPIASATLRFENAAGQVLTHPAGYVVFSYKPGPRQLADLQALVSRTAQLLQDYAWHGILGDQRQMQPLTAAESAFMVEFWQAYTQQHAPLYSGVVLAQDVFARLAASQLKQQLLASGITYQQFDSEAAAAAWLTARPGGHR